MIKTVTADEAHRFANRKQPDMIQEDSPWMSEIFLS